MKEIGVLVGLDESIEWLLPWFYSRFSNHCALDIAFADFGMSKSARSFCKERGELLFLSPHPTLGKKPEHAAKWEEIFGKKLWKNRGSWFKKPLALSQSPFERSLWLDLDCEVLSDLRPLFSLQPGMHLAVETPPALARERELSTIHPDETLYNSGVILFDRDEPLIPKWIEAITKEGDAFWSDQHALSRVIYQESIPVHTLHEDYNWRMSQGLNIHAKIIHWVGSWGKEYIKEYGGLGDDLATLPKI